MYGNDNMHLFKNYRIKTDETIVENVDAELIEDREYASMGKTPADRIKAFLGKIDSVRDSQAKRTQIANFNGLQIQVVPAIP